MVKVNGLPLPKDFLLMFNSWELHEASFILTTWPSNMVIRAIPLEFSSILGRNVIYTPNEKLSLKQLEKRTRELFTSLKTALKNNEIRGISFQTGLENYFGDQTTHFLPVYQLINWFLKKGFLMPQRLQEYLQSYQIVSRNWNQNQVKNKFLGQLAYLRNPRLTFDMIRNHTLISKYGPQYNDRDKRAVHNDLNELFQPELEQGKCTRFQYELSPLDEVIQLHNSVYEYDFPSLATISKLMCRIKIDEKGVKALSDLTEERFLNEIENEPLITIYLKNSSKLTKEFFDSACYEEFNMMYPHPEIIHMPRNKRNQMTIRELKTLNWELCFARFTPEEREQYNICKPYF